MEIPTKASLDNKYMFRFIIAIKVDITNIKPNITYNIAVLCSKILLRIKNSPVKIKKILKKDIG
jgi:hypothetical protein